MARGAKVMGSSVLLATCVCYRRLGIPELDAFIGVGISHGVGRSEARAPRGQDVFVIRAGNSAGQAEIHPGRHAARVTILARGDTLAASIFDSHVGEIG